MRERRVLFVAPHSDDELFGAACTLLQMKESGYRIRMILVCCSDIKMRHVNKVVTQDERRAEFLRSAKALSTEPPVVLDFEDSFLDVRPMSDLVTKLDEQLDDFKPDVLFLPEPSYHQDHQYVNRACLAAIRPTGKHVPDRILAYEVPTSTSVGFDFASNYYVVANGHLKMKLQLFEECYGSQYTTKDRGALAADGILRHAQYRGIEIGCDAAEAFLLMREVIR